MAMDADTFNTCQSKTKHLCCLSCKTYLFGQFLVDLVVVKRTAYQNATCTCLDGSLPSCNIYTMYLEIFYIIILYW